MTRTPVIDRIRTWTIGRDASAVRNAISMGLPLAVGTAFGDPAAGGLAAIGAFTAMYTHNLPYRQRLAQWVFIAALVQAGFVIGALAAGPVWLGVGVIGAAAMVLTYLMKVVAIGPPAAYILILVCATGTHLPPDLGALGGRMLVVAAGSVAALLVCMAGWLTAPDAPERALVAAAMTKVAAVVGDPDASPGVRHAARRALHIAAVALSRGSRRGNTGRLAEVVRELRHLVDRSEREQPACESPDTADGLKQVLIDAAADLRGGWPLRRERFDLSRVRIAAEPTLAGVLTPLAAREVSYPELLTFPGPFAVWKARSPRALRSGLRAALAATAAGCVAIALDIDRPYWGAVAAVAVLANDGTRATVSRAWARFAGTVGGVIVAAGIISTHPSPWVIVGVVAGLQFLIQLVISYSYGLAVVAITPLALLLADAATGQSSLTDLLPRLLETAIGCALGLMARLLVFPNSSARHLPKIIDVVERRNLLWDSLSGRAVPAVRDARLALERALLALEDAIQAARDELRPTPSTTADIARASDLLDRIWPTVVLQPRPDGFNSAS